MLSDGLGQGYTITHAGRVWQRRAVPDPELHLQRVEPVPGQPDSVKNDRAIRAYERAGFQRKGVIRQAVQREGQRHDMLLYGILREEWVSKRAQRT